MITSLHAAILGFVEGLTEFLPVSSTGHLILTAHWLGLGYGKGVKAFEIVIQSGALLAVISLYLPSIRAMLLGLLGKDAAGLKLAKLLLIAFLPAAVVGVLAQGWIKAELFGAWPVVLALAGGGVAMILVERYQKRDDRISLRALDPGRTLEQMTLSAALIIGCAQCLAMWPGTSRSMVTILAALMLGFRPGEAAKFSFLLALPTLGAATAHDLVKDGREILAVTQASGLATGFVVSCVVAWLAVKGFVAYLNRHGLAVFGWYRLAAAAVMAVALMSQVTLMGTIRCETQPGASDALTLIEIPGKAGAERLYPIVPNPVGQELAKLVGYRVIISGSELLAQGNIPARFKALSYLVLKPAPHAQTTALTGH